MSPLSTRFLTKFAGNRLFGFAFLCGLLFFSTNEAKAQMFPRRAREKADTAKITDRVEKTNAINDTARGKSVKDSLAKGDSLKVPEGLRISKDALENVVTTKATDSATMDMETNNFVLFGNAQVDYEGKKLSAHRIDFNQSSNVATAIKATEEDTSSKSAAEPTFEQGAEKFTYDRLQYNFKSSRAIVQNARSQYGEGFVISQQVKRNADESFYGYKNVYTTCSLREPHFGIRTNRIKVIPEQAIASGPANIEVEGVPTPLFLPFGYFPVNNEKHRSGFILPTYNTEPYGRGLGLLNGGYYLYLNDYVDLQLQGDVYTRGSFRGAMTSNYITRYRYYGKLALSYAVNKTGESYEPNASVSKDYSIYWSHTKDAKSLPGVSFNANVDIVSGNYNRYNSYTANQIVKNQLQSNVSFSKNWVTRPYLLTIGLTHNQNLLTKEVSLGLPNATFSIPTFTPFQRRSAVGKARWYEKITGGYTVTAANRLNFDSTFELGKLRLTDFQNGIRHSIPVSASYTVARFVTATFGLNYNEYWNTIRSRKAYNDLTGRLDTTDIEHGFYATRDFSTSVNFSTAIYGMKLFKHGTIRGFRHTIRPSLRFGYRPDFAKSPFNYAYRTRLDASQNLTYVSPYEMAGGIAGVPAVGKDGRVEFELGNNLQMKVRNKKDTATGFKNIGLLDALQFNTSYNIAADSFQWANYVFQARTNIANLVNISANANFDPYLYDYNQMRRTPRLMRAAGEGWARLTDAQIVLNTSFHSRPKNVNPNDSTKQSASYKSLMRNNGYDSYVDFNIPWNLNLNYNLLLNRTPSPYSKSDTSIVQQNVGISADFNFTPRWKLVVSTGYNLTLKQVAITSVDIYRDLHCWEMRLGLIPFGLTRSFNFSLNVKAQVLQDLKLTRRSTQFNNVY